MKEEFVSFEQAQALKECGFDWECDQAYYDNLFAHRHPLVHSTEANEEDRNCDGTKIYYAPTLTLAQKWLREVKGIDVEVRLWLVGDEREYRPHVYPPKKKDYIALPPSNTYEFALSASITAALELIKQK